MEALEVLRAVLGLGLVLFLPGFVLTLALWPMSKREVAHRVVEELKKRNIHRASILGSERDVEELIDILREHLEVEVNPEKTGRACILTGDLEGEDITVPEAEVIIDLGDNASEAVKVEDTIDGVERIALSFGLSVALVPILGIILDKTPYGIHTGSVLSAILLVIFIFTAVYYHRRKSLEMRPWPSF
jgi:hypothetical protein